MAVFELKNLHLTLGDAVLTTLREYLSTKLAASGAFHVVPDQSMQKALLTKRKESYEQRFDMATQVELGRELAAQLTLATQIMKGGTKCLVSVTLFDLKKSTAQKAELAEATLRLTTRSVE